MSTAFVTGATGLVGSALCKRLVDDGHEVVALVLDLDPHSALVMSGDIGRVRVINGAVDDVRTVERALAQYRPSTVFHLAAQTQVTVALSSPYETFESNVRGTYALLEACRRIACARAIVVASSDKAYGDADVLPYDEDTPLRGTFPYDASKSCTDIIAKSFAATYALPVAIARCGNIFGGGDLNWDRLVPSTIRSLLRNERPVLRSDGKMVRDWIFVDDVVDAYVALALKGAGGAGEAFNFSYETPRDVLAIVSAVTTAMGSTLLPVIEAKATHEIKAQHLSAAKAKRVLGWSATTPFDVAMAKTVAWYRNYFARFPLGTGGRV